jgi:hypothetical protein
MRTIALDNVESVQYQDSLITKGWLSSIHVVFSKSGHIMNYFGPGLRLALDLLREQFHPKTEAESSLVEQPVPTPIDFDIDVSTLEISASLEKLKDLGYTKLLAAAKQAEQFGYFQSGGRPLNVNGLREAIQTEINRQKPQA